MMMGFVLALYKSNRIWNKYNSQNSNHCKNDFGSKMNLQNLNKKYHIM